MNFPDQYHAAAVWQQHVLDERNQRRLAQLVARRQRRRERTWTVRSVLARVVRLRRHVAGTPAPAAPRSRPVGCAV